MPKGVIFDMDGVLVDSGTPHAESWRLLAKNHNVAMSETLFKSTFGQTNRDIIPQMFGPDVSEAQIQALGDEKEALYREIITGNIPLMPGCQAMLTALHKAGFVMAVATSGPPENVQVVIHDSGIGPFEAVVTAEDIQRGKPAPDCFQLAAKRIGVSPEQAVVVEDAPVGIQAGVAARMKVIGLTGTHPADRLQQAGAHKVVDALSEITPELVDSLL